MDGSRPEDTFLNRQPSEADAFERELAAVNAGVRRRHALARHAAESEALARVETERRGRALGEVGVRAGSSTVGAVRGGELAAGTPGSANPTLSPAAAQVVAAIAEASGRGASFVLRLQPPELGEVAVRFFKQGEKLKVRLMSGRPETAALLAKELPRLELALSARAAGSIEVEVDAGGSGSEQGQAGQARGEAGSRRGQPASARSASATRSGALREADELPGAPPPPDPSAALHRLDLVL